MKKPNVPMNNPITTCRQKVDKEKYDKNYERIFGKATGFKEVPVCPHCKQRIPNDA